MEISPTILMSKILISIFIFILQSILLHYLNKRDIINTKLLINISILFMLILCLPFEFPFTISVPSKIIMPYFFRLLTLKLYLNFQIVHLILAIWITGTIIHLIHLVIKYYKLSRFVKFCTRNIIELEINDSLKHNYSILKLNIPDAPMVIGLFKPIIVLPDLQFSHKELEFILKHECLHISNRDLLIKYLYEFFVCIYWWNPVVYSFRNYTNQLIEIRTDELATNSYSNQEKIDYINSLIKVTTINNYGKTNPFSVYFTTSNKNLLFYRSQNILLQTKTPKRTSRKNIASISFCIIMFFILSSFVFEPYFINDSDSQNTFEISSENAYLIKSNDEYHLYVNDQYIAPITDLESDPNLKSLKIISRKD
jgi:Antirepressor regulating drug resistance, predicted signal transduction N-terminal membrane component